MVEMNESNALVSRFVGVSSASSRRVSKAMRAVCAFCRDISSSNPVLGEVIVSHDFAVHLNCLYAASGLIQRTDPDARSLSKRRRYIFGFDIEEVEAEICRGRRLRCRYCGNPGACVGCTKRTCPYSFHLPCLYDSKGFVCFKKSFEAFCYKHCPKQDLLSRLLECGDDPPICCICLFSVIPDDDSEKNSASVNKCSKASAILRNYASSLDQDLVHKHSVKSRQSGATNTYPTSNTTKVSLPKQYLDWINRLLDERFVLKTARSSLVMTMLEAWCHGVIHGGCCRLAWMHRDCIAAYSRSAGLHHVKCPICSDRDVFIPMIIDFGVWVPDRDASWELEPDSFAMSETSSSGLGASLSRSVEFVAEGRSVESLPSSQNGRPRPPPTRRRRRNTTASTRSLSRPTSRQRRCEPPVSYHDHMSKTSTLIVEAGVDENKENVNSSSRSGRLTRRHDSGSHIDNNSR